MAYVVETNLLRQPGVGRDPLERFAVGIRVQHTSIAALADEPQVLPSRTMGNPSFGLFLFVPPERLDGERR